MSIGSVSFGESLKALSELLKPNDDEYDYAEAPAPCGNQNPGSVGPQGTFKDVKPPDVKRPRDARDIWEEEELQDDIEDDELEDGRQKPRYEFIYKQAIETTDAFLGMSGKDPSSTSCETMVVRLELPGTGSVKELDLDVQPNSLKLRSNRYRLSTYLPHKVDHERGEARWDSRAEVLSVSLPIVREELFP